MLAEQPTTESGNSGKRRFGKLLSIALPLLLGLFLIIYQYRQFTPAQLQEMKRYFRTADYFYIGLSLVVALFGYLSRAHRWTYSLRHMGYRSSFKNNLLAVCISYFINLTIPRSGEISRAVVVKKYESVPFDKAFGSIVAERVVDLIIFLFFGYSISAQSPYRLTLDEVVALAQSDAPDALLASTRWKHSYWTYQSYLADFKPQIILQANTLPLFNRTIESIPLQNGGVAFKERSFMENQLNLSLQQDFAPTGGTLFFGSGLSRLDLFATGGVPASTSYLSNPLSLGFSQPLFQYNDMKWRKKIEPIIYKESEKQ